MPHLLLALSMLLLLPLRAIPVCAAEVYRWTDEQGRVHFSDRAPQDGTIEASAVAVPVAPAQPDPEMQRERERSRKLLEVWDTERQQRLESEQQASAAAEQRAQRCALLLAHLEETQRSRYLYRASPEGEQEILDDAGRAAYQQQLQTLVDTQCR